MKMICGWEIDQLERNQSRSLFASVSLFLPNATTETTVSQPRFECLSIAIKNGNSANRNVNSSHFMPVVKSTSTHLFLTVIK